MVAATAAATEMQNIFFLAFQILCGIIKTLQAKETKAVELYHSELR